MTVVIGPPYPHPSASTPRRSLRANKVLDLDIYSFLLVYEMENYTSIGAG